MKGLRFIAAIGLALVPVAAFAAGSTTSTGTTAAQTSQATVTIPAVIAIDVESNFTFDFNTYPAPAGPSSCTNVFPPGAGCANVTYTPAINAVGATAGAGHLWIAIFSNKSAVQATMDVTAEAPTAFTGGNPGFTPQSIRLLKGTSNNVTINGATFGPTTATALTGTDVTPLSIKNGALTSSVFGWSRIDQIPDLFLPGSQTFNEVTGVTANVTFTLKY